MTKIWITRRWRERGIYEREATIKGSMAITDEDTGLGRPWTPYDIGSSAFLTRAEAEAFVVAAIDAEIRRLQAEWEKLVRIRQGVSMPPATDAKGREP